MEKAIEELNGLDTPFIKKQAMKEFEEALEMLSDGEYREGLLEFISGMRHLHTKWMRNRERWLKDNIKDLEIDVSSPDELKDFVCSFRTMKKKGVYKGRWYNFKYTPEFADYFELRRRREQKERGRQHARNKNQKNVSIVWVDSDSDSDTNSEN